MLCPDTLRRLARRLDRTADRVGELGQGGAAQVAGVTWECRRGRRAVRRAGGLATAAGRDAALLRAAARHLGLAADDIGSAGGPVRWLP